MNPPETQTTLFQVDQEEKEDSFSTLLKYQRQLRSGIDPKLIGSGTFQLQNLKLYRQADENSQALAVPTSEREAESIVCWNYG